MVPARVLVVGATGALRPAALELAASGATVVAWALHQQRLDDLVAAASGPVQPVAVDYADQERTTATLAALAPVDAALLYCPAAPEDAVTAFVRSTTGAVVQTLMSAVARPLADEPFDLTSVPLPDRCRRLVLGWVEDHGRRRWHTPDEISAAALDVLSTGRERVLGVVRPWKERPT